MNKAYYIDENETEWKYPAEGTSLDIYGAEIIESLNTYHTPVLAAIGIVGNCISLYVFYKSKLHRISTSHYLSALALTDNCFLGQLTFVWLGNKSYWDIFHHEIFCQLFVYMTYVCTNLSAWLVVAFTLERYVAVLYPLQRELHCTMCRARLVVGILTCISLTMNLPMLRFAKPKPFCNVDIYYMDQAEKFNMFDTLVSLTIPLALIVAFNIWIAIAVWKLERARCMLTITSTTQFRVTKMLLIVSSVYVVLNLPAYIMRLAAYHHGLRRDESWIIKMQHIAIICYNTNFGINFILYCLTGQNFRSAVVQSFPWLGFITSICRRGDRNLMNTASPPTTVCRRFNSNAIEMDMLDVTPTSITDKKARQSRIGSDEITLTAEYLPGKNSISRPSTISTDGSRKRWIFHDFFHIHANNKSVDLEMAMLDTN